MQVAFATALDRVLRNNINTVLLLCKANGDTLLLGSATAVGCYATAHHTYAQTAYYRTVATQRQHSMTGPGCTESSSNV